VVYEALDLERNARVALKALTQRDALNIYRLKNEFRQLADLSHPNPVPLPELLTTMERLAAGEIAGKVMVTPGAAP